MAKFPEAMTKGGMSLFTAEAPPMMQWAPIRVNWWTPVMPADDGVILHVDVAGEVRRIGHDDVVPQLAVVGDMAVGHQQVVVADDR